MINEIGFTEKIFIILYISEIKNTIHFRCYMLFIYITASYVEFLISTGMVHLDRGARMFDNV